MLSWHKLGAKYKYQNNTIWIFCKYLKLNIVITFVFIMTFDIRLRASKWKVNWISIILISIFK